MIAFRRPPRVLTERELTTRLKVHRDSIASYHQNAWDPRGFPNAERAVKRVYTFDREDEANRVYFPSKTGQKILLFREDRPDFVQKPEPNSDKFGSKRKNEHGEVLEVKGLSLVSFYGMVTKTLSGKFYVSPDILITKEVRTQRGIELTIEGLPDQLALHVDFPSKKGILDEDAPIRHYSLIVADKYEEEGLIKEELRDAFDIWAKNFRFTEMEFPENLGRKKNQVELSKNEMCRFDQAQQNIEQLSPEEQKIVCDLLEMYRPVREDIREIEGKKIK